MQAVFEVLEDKRSFYLLAELLRNYALVCLDKCKSTSR